MTFRDAWDRGTDEDRHALDYRAAIIEYDGGLSRQEAERLALEEYISRREGAGR